MATKHTTVFMAGRQAGKGFKQIKELLEQRNELLAAAKTALAALNRHGDKYSADVVAAVALEDAITKAEAV